MNNLSKYREEAERLYPAYDPETGQGLVLNRSVGAAREAHIAARLLSEQAIADACIAMREYTLNNIRGLGLDSDASIHALGSAEDFLAEYLSTHTPPLIDLEAIMNDTWDAALIKNKYGIYSETIPDKQQYITEKKLL